ncbi:hypothetical protein ACJIZ3_004315 [Penstemon smallii]|uniref:Uncharacterized protein n=1 Tax=Penstemon smallii TaxID=265156 RepID=A0ABD3S1V0_9LAMI
MATARSGAGGKIVPNRRKQRLAVTPYDRPPPPPPSPPLPQKNPNWFAGIVVPSARALASGAGKIISSMFSEPESSSSEDEDSASEDDVDVDNDNEHEIPYDGVNALNEKNASSSEMMQHEQDSPLSAMRTETKRLIEQLIMQEIFSREECDRLVRVLNSRVMDWSGEAVGKSFLAASTGMIEHEDVDIYNKAVSEAKKWFQEKKVGSSSVTESAHWTCNHNSSGPEHVGSGGGSPVDVARSYMKERPPWASPTKNNELGTPLTSKYFREGASYSVAYDSLSSSKRRSSLASGSWNIQEELRRVRSKATEDMLRTPSGKIDPSGLVVASISQKSAGAGNVVSDMGVKTTEPESLWKTKLIDALVDAGVSSDPALAALESRQDSKPNEAPSSKPATSASGNNEDSESVQMDDECAASKYPHLSSPKHAEEHLTDPHLSKTNGDPATEVTKIGGRPSVNGLSSSQASLSAGEATGKNIDQYDVENEIEDTTATENKVNTTNVEGNHELLNEAYMEVPIVTETDSIASGSQNSLGLQYEESSLDMAQPSTKGKLEILTGKQPVKRSGRTTRRSRGRGK